jgi:hypothetical protein
LPKFFKFNRVTPVRPAGPPDHGVNLFAGGQGSKPLACVSVNKAYLYRIMADGSPGEQWAVGDSPLVVGRDEPADACVDDEALSRSHFLVVREGADFILVDLSSSNGTKVNDGRIAAHKLKSGEIIRAGSSAFCFSLTPPPTVVPAQLLATTAAAARRDG